MPIDLAAINPLLKDEYEDYVSELVHTETTALDSFTSGDTSSSADGRRMIIPAHVRRDHAGVGFVGEGRQLPTPVSEQSVFYTIPFRKSAARFQTTKEAIDQSQTNRGSFVRALSFIMDHLVENLVDIRNKAICHFGSDILARVNGNPAASATTITVDDPGGVAMPAGVSNGSRFLQVGQVLAGIRGNTLVGPVTVAGIAPGGNYNQITLAANTADFADNDVLVRAHATGITDITDTSYLQAPMGLLGLIDDGGYVENYFGVSRSTWDVVKAYVFPNTGTLSNDLIQQGVDVAYARGRGKIQFFLCEQSVRRAMLAVTEGETRYVVGAEGAGNVNRDFGSKVGQNQGKGGISWSTLEVRVDYNFPFGVLLGVDPAAFVHYNVVPGKFEDWGGSVLVPAAQTHVATGLYYIYDNFFNDAPNKSARWDGVNATVVNIHVE